LLSFWIFGSLNNGIPPAAKYENRAQNNAILNFVINYHVGNHFSHSNLILKLKDEAIDIDISVIYHNLYVQILPVLDQKLILWRWTARANPNRSGSEASRRRMAGKNGSASAAGQPKGHAGDGTGLLTTTVASKP
jgi:hypothetical protein